MSHAERVPPGAMVIVPADDERLNDVATRAIQDQMFVIHDGEQIIVCSVIPVGWRKLGIGDRTRMPHRRVSPTEWLTHGCPVGANGASAVS